LPNFQSQFPLEFAAQRAIPFDDNGCGDTLIVADAGSVADAGGPLMPDDRYESDEKRKKRRRGPDDDDEDTDEEDRPRRRKGRRDDDDAPRRSGDGGVGYVIPYKNVPALIGYYIGVLGLLACFLGGLSVFTGAAALVLGIMGMMRASKNPEAHGRGHAITGIVLGAVQLLAGCGWIPFYFLMLTERKR
jgi:hypothetical protein